MPAKECFFYEKLKDGVVKCTACNHYCTINEGRNGICGVRKNISGKLFLMVYGRVVSKNIDPVEKKPLYHFFPGTNVYSVGTIGCNFKCRFCQNWEISQEKDYELGDDLSPEMIVKQAIDSKCKSIAYTYNEPTVAIEYWMDVMKLAKKKGLKNIWVSNGYMSKEALNKISKFIDAMNIDLKSFNDDFYKTECKAKLSPVLETIKLAKSLGIWVEITTLLIPGKNDSAKEVEKIAKFIKSVDESMPLHLSRYFPSFLSKQPPTPIQSMRNAYGIAKKYLINVYLGNIASSNDTICPNCKKTIIKRIGYNSLIHVKNSKCEYCKSKVEGFF